MSGYWFFRMDINESDIMNKIGKKLKKKVGTLVIPYILWNCFGMIFYMGITRIPMLSAMMNNGDTIPINVGNVLGGIFNHKYYFIFWYMQDLVVITFILTPLILLLLKNKVTAFISVFSLLLISLFNLNLPFLHTSSVMYFLVGGCLAVYFREWFEYRSSVKVSAICFLIFIICCVIRFVGIAILEQIVLYASPILLWKSFDFLNFENKAKWFQKQSFFIYASHIIPVTVIGHILKKVGSGDIWASFAFVLAIIITACIIWIMAKLLSKFVPSFYKLICGGR